MDASKPFSTGTRATQSQSFRLLSHLFPRRSSDNMKSSKKGQQPALGLSGRQRGSPSWGGQPGEGGPWQPTPSTSAVLTRGHSHTWTLSWGRGPPKCSGDCLRLLFDTDMSPLQQSMSSQHFPDPEMFPDQLPANLPDPGYLDRPKESRVPRHYIQRMQTRKGF